MADPFVFPPLKHVLAELGVRPSTLRDQHFLRSPASITRIADACGLDPGTGVVEIGAGLGNLSAELAARAARVVAVEKDHSFTRWHATLSNALPNLAFEYADVLKSDLAALAALAAPSPDSGVVATGNLPYSITAPILFKLLEAPVPWRRIVVMVQREVADRIVAGAGVRASGALTIKLALAYESQVVMRLPPGEFLPPPKVHSAVVVLHPRAVPLLRDDDHRRRVFGLVTAAYGQRRKRLDNALAGGGAFGDRDAARATLLAAGIDPGRRAETLSLDEFLALADVPAQG